MHSWSAPVVARSLAYPMVERTILLAGDGTTVTKVVITSSNNYLDIAEVKLYSAGSQISTSSLSFSLTSVYMNNWPASYANDGNLGTHCTGASTTSDSLTITLSAATALSQIIIYPRQDCCAERTNGASVVGYSGTTSVWSTTIPSTSSSSYTYTGE